MTRQRRRRREYRAASLALGSLVSPSGFCPGMRPLAKGKKQTAACIEDEHFLIVSSCQDLTNRDRGIIETGEPPDRGCMRQRKIPSLLPHQWSSKASLNHVLSSHFAAFLPLLSPEEAVSRPRPLGSAATRLPQMSLKQDATWALSATGVSTGPRRLIAEHTARRRVYTANKPAGPRSDVLI